MGKAVDIVTVTSSASWAKKIGREKKLQYSDGQLEIPTQKVMGVQKFNFATKFPKIGHFSSKLCIFGRQLPDMLKCRGGKIAA